MTSSRKATTFIFYSKLVRLTQLHQAAEVVDNQRLTELVDQLTLEQADLAETLTNLMNQFRVDKIIDLAERALSKK